MVSSYEVYALHYATHARAAVDNFLYRDQSLVADPHNIAMPLEYFVWVARSPERTIVIDTGFDESTARLRGRVMLRDPIDQLRAVGVDPALVDDVIVTHLHYDHAGNLEPFTNATFHLQDSEMAFATGRCMCHLALRHAYAVEDVVTMVRRLYQGRVRFHDSDAVLFPGLSVHKVPGHTPGLQCVRVATARGNVVLASDASHFYANREQSNPFPILTALPDMVESWDRLGQLADSEDHIVPGHDGLVLQRYPKQVICDVTVSVLHEAPVHAG